MDANLDDVQIGFLIPVRVEAFGKDEDGCGSFFRHGEYDVGASWVFFKGM